MQHDVKLNDEAARLAAVHRYDILDTPPEPEFDKLVALVKSVFLMPIAFISVIDDKRQWYKARDGFDLVELPRGTSFCNQVVRSRDVIVVGDMTLDARFREHPFVVDEPRIRSYLGAPLTSPDGYNVGTLCVLGTEPRAFTDGDVSMLRHFADVAVSQFELRQIASYDALTGALSRRAFQDALTKELARSRRHGDPASLVLFDLDHFKRINDTHGHAVGDAVLKTVVDVCSEQTRGEDVIGRLGGEEFAALFVAAPEDGSMAAADRLRSAIEAAHVAGRPDLHFTASFGVADCTAETTDQEAWLARADAALYEAKAAGRNRCVVAGGR